MLRSRFLVVAAVCLAACVTQAVAATTRYDLWDVASWGGKSAGYLGPTRNQFTQGGYNGSSATGAFVSLQAASWGEVFCWPGQTGTGYGGYTLKWLNPTQDAQQPPAYGWRQYGEIRQLEASRSLSGEQWIVNRWTAPLTGIAVIHMGAYGRNNWNLSGVNVVIAKNRVAIKSGWFEGFDGSPNMGKDVRGRGGDAVDCHVVYDDTIGVVAGDVLDIGSNGDGRGYYPDATIEFIVDLTPGEFVAGTVKEKNSGTPIEGATVKVDGGTESTTTRANGTFDLVVSPGTYTIRVSKTGYTDETFPVTLAANQASVGNVVELSLSKGTIEGNVSAASPVGPIDYATVEAIGSGVPPTTTAADGSYRLLVPPGSYTVNADRFGYLPQQFSITVGGGETLTRDFQLSNDPTEPLFFYYNLWASASWGGKSSGFKGPVMNQFTQGGYDGDASSGVFIELEAASWSEVFCWPGQTGTGYGGYTMKWLYPTQDSSDPPGYGWRQNGEVTQKEASDGLAGEQWIVNRWTAPVPGTASVHMGAYGRNNWNLSGANVVIAKNRVAIKSGWFEGFDGSPMMAKDVRGNGGDAVDCHVVYDGAAVAVAQGDVLDVATNHDGRDLYGDATIEFTIGVVPAPEVVAGVVTNSATTPWPGTPIEGATVEIVGGASTTTDAGGVYYLVLPAGTSTIRFSKTDYQTKQFSVTRGAQWIRRDADLSLVDGIVQGVVKSGASAPRPNEPLVGATVEVVSGGSGTVTTGANGTYYLSLPPGNHTIRSSMPGYKSQDLTANVTAGGNVVRDYQLDANYSVWDALRDFSGQRNPNGLWSYGQINEDTKLFSLLPSQVTWAADVPPGAVEGWDRGGNTLSDPMGYPHFVRNATGADFVVPGHNELMEASRLHTAPWSSPLQGALRWTAPVTGDYTVSASFKTWKSASTVGAFVYSSSRSIDWLSAVVGENGYQSMTATATLTAGETVSFAVNDGYDGPLSDSVSITADVELNLAGKALIMGKVRNSATTPWPGTPISGATVKVDGRAESTTTLSDGTYYLVASPGSLTVRVSKTGYLDGTFPITVAADEATIGHDVDLSLSSGVFTGIVTAAGTGDPIKDATVNAIGSGVTPATTAADGSYLLLVPPGAYTVEADKFGYLPQQFPLTVVGGQRISQNFSLSKDATEIELFHYDLWDWASWGGRSAGYLGPNMNQFTQGGYDGTAQTGAFVELQAGSWGEVFCWPGQTGSGYGGYTRKSLDPTYDEQNAGAGHDGWRQLGEIRQLEASYTLPGEQWIVNRWTAPVPGSAVVHMGTYGRNNMNLSGANVIISKNRSTIKSGWFEGFDGSPNMTKDVRGFGGDAVDCHVVYDGTVAVNAGDVLDIGSNHDGRAWYGDATIEFTVQLTPSANVIAGVVVNSATTPWPGTPVQGATVQLVGGATTTTDARGVYVLVLPAGTSTVRVSKTDYLTQQFSVTVGSQWIRRNVELSLEKGVLSGTVRSGPGAPRPNEPIVEATVEVVGGTDSVKTGDQGAYQFLLPGGTYTLRAGMPGYLPQEAQVTLAGGTSISHDFALAPDPDAWDALRDFSAASNPNGTWSYGYKELGIYHKVTSNVTWAGFVPAVSVEGWDYGGNSLSVPQGYPCWVRNKTGASLTVDAWTLTLHAGRLFTYPLAAYESVPARWSVMRWTAPAAGTYSIYASFRANQPATAGVAVYSSTGSVDWSSPLVGLGTEVTVAAEGVQLESGETLDFEVNGGTDGSSWGDSAEILATVVAGGATQAARISEVKGLANGTKVKLTAGKVVTAGSGTYSDGSYYVEEPDRSSGIKVAPRSGLPAVALGDRITLTGVMATDANGERYIDAISIDSQTAGDQTSPLGVNNKGVGAAPELSGLLVKMWGNVTYKAGDNSYVYIDDGASRQDGSGQTGVRVILNGLSVPITTIPNMGQFVSVIGPAGRGAGGVPAIRPRRNADIKIGP